MSACKGSAGAQAEVWKVEGLREGSGGELALPAGCSCCLIFTVSLRPDLKQLPLTPPGGPFISRYLERRQHQQPQQQQWEKTERLPGSHSASRAPLDQDQLSRGDSWEGTSQPGGGDLLLLLEISLGVVSSLKPATTLLTSL